MDDDEINLVGVSHARFKVIVRSLCVFERHKYINHNTLGALETLCYEYGTTRVEAFRFFPVSDPRDVVKLSRLIKRLDSELKQAVAGGWYGILTHITKRAGLRLSKAQMAALRDSVSDHCLTTAAEDKYKVSKGVITAITPVVRQMMASYKDYIDTLNRERKMNGEVGVSGLTPRRAVPKVFERAGVGVLHNLGVKPSGYQLSLELS
jgi:hypothetical protein